MKAINEIKNIDLETERLYLKKPTMDEQYDLWNILKDRNVYKYYMAIPDRFNNDREAFEKEFNDWNKQKKYHQSKIDNLEDNANKFTWSIFLKSGELIGQMTVQPKKQYNNPAVRDVGWVIAPKYQGNGYAYEAAKKILEFMFEVVEIERIETAANVVNPASWKLMEKLGFIRVGKSLSDHLDQDGNYLDQYNYSFTRDRYFEFNNKKEK